MSELNNDMSAELDYHKFEATAKSIRDIFTDLDTSHWPTLMFNPDTLAGNADNNQKLREAAVLIPLINYSDGLKVLLTQRTHDLNSHAGQISFPGGTFEAQDHNDPVATALRETEEEIGIHRSIPNVVGRLPRYQTGSGFEITPIVALLDPPVELRLQESEVASAFEVPFSFLTDPENYSLEYLNYQGENRAFYKAPYKQHGIWGATAGILFGFYEILAGYHQHRPKQK